MKTRSKPWFEVVGDLVVIHAPDSASGVPLEYEYLEERFGERDSAWKFVSQHLMPLESGGWMDILVIELADGTRRELRFDISELSRGFGSDRD